MNRPRFSHQRGAGGWSAPSRHSRPRVCSCSSTISLGRSRSRSDVRRQRLSWLHWRPCDGHTSAAATVETPGTSGAASPYRAATRQSSIPTNLGWTIAGWTTAIAALALVMRAPSVQLALVAYVVALAVIEIDGESRSSGNPLAPGLMPACLSYVSIRFAVDLARKSDGSRKRLRGRPAVTSAWRGRRSRRPSR